MKRAILVTTGTIVGVASVIAYKPSPQALASVLGAEGLTIESTLTPKDPETSESASAPAATAEATSSSAAPVTEAATSGATAVPSPKTSSASPTASASATRTAKPTATSAPTASATPTSGTSAVDLSSIPDGTYTGTSETVESRGRYFGTLVASVTVNAGKITQLSFNQNPAGRNQRFIDAVNSVLVPAIIQSQNVTVGIVTGATGTSLALVYSLESALQSA